MSKSNFWNDPQIKKAIDLLRQRLRDFTKEHNLSIVDLARQLGVSDQTLKHFTEPGNKRLPNDKNLAQITKLGLGTVFSEDDVSVLEIANSRMASLAHSGAKKKKGSSEGGTVTKRPSPLEPAFKPSVANVDSRDNSNRHVQSVLDKEKICQAISLLGEVVSVPATAVLDLLLAQLHDRYEVGDMSAVLSAETFQTINVLAWNTEQLNQLTAYANFTLEEARRCLLLIAQLSPNEVREDLVDRLRRNLALFWPTYKAASSVHPHEYVRSVELETLCGGMAKS